MLRDIVEDVFEARRYKEVADTCRFICSESFGSGEKFEECYRECVRHMVGRIMILYALAEAVIEGEDDDG